MRFQKLDLNLLVALDRLLVEKSITRAAVILHLSQSATSSILGRLREYFDDDLLTSVGRNMIPTALALSLQDPVRQLLLQIQTTLEIRPEFIPEQCDRHFRIVASDYTTSLLLTRVARHLHREAPKVALEVMQPLASSVDHLMRGEVDLLFMPEHFKIEAYPGEVVLEDSYSCVVWAGNQRIGDTITAGQYLSMGHVSVNFTGGTESFESWVFEKEQIKRRVEVVATSFTALPQLLLGTDRIATMHTRLARQFAQYFPIRILSLPLDIPNLQLFMQWHSFQDKDPAHQWLRQVMKEMGDADR